MFKWQSSCKIEFVAEYVHVHQSPRTTRQSGSRAVPPAVASQNRFLVAPTTAPGHTTKVNIKYTYGVATISRLLKITGLFCKRALQKRLHSARSLLLVATPCIYIYTYTYIYVYIYIHVHVYIHICIHLHIKDTYKYIYIYTCIHIYIHIYIYIHMYMYIHLHIHIDINTHLHVYTCTYTCTYTYTCICIYTYIHIYMYIYIYIHIHRYVYTYIFIHKCACMYVRIYYIKSPFVAGAILFLQNAPKKKHTKDSHHIIIAQNAKKKNYFVQWWCIRYMHSCMCKE